MSSFQKLDIDVSDKDIPSPTPKAVKLMLIKRTEDFLIRLRWKIIHFLSPNNQKMKQNGYGYRTDRFPQQVRCEALTGFERDMWSMIKNVKTRKIRNEHQDKLNAIIETIRNTDNIVVNSDKTGNKYLVKKKTIKE